MEKSFPNSKGLNLIFRTIQILICLIVISCHSSNNRVLPTKGIRGIKDQRKVISQQERQKHYQSLKQQAILDNIKFDSYNQTLCPQLSHLNNHSLWLSLMLILANVSEVHTQISTTVSPIASTANAYTNSTLATVPYIYQQNNGTHSTATIKTTPSIASYYGSSSRPTHSIQANPGPQLTTTLKKEKHKKENVAASVKLSLPNEKFSPLVLCQINTDLQTKSIEEHPVNRLTSEALQLSIFFQNILGYLKNCNDQPEEYSYLERADKKLIRFDTPIIHTFYRNIEYIGEGMSNRIFKAILIQSRATKPEGSTIALRVASASSLLPPNMLRTYARLSKLRSHNISPYIPEIISIYLAPYSEIFKKELRYGDRIIMEGKPMVRIWEMDYLDKSYEDEYEKSSRKSMEPRVIFEEIIGRWAVDVVAKCEINDEDGDVLRHHMLYYDPNYVVYHIDDKLYLFEPGYSPRQVDYDDGICRDSDYSLKHYKEGYLPSHQDKYYQSSYMHERAPTDSIKRFLDEIEIKGLFRSIKDNLVEFEVSPTNPIPATDNVQHFYIPEEYIKI